VVEDWFNVFGEDFAPTLNTLQISKIAGKNPLNETEALEVAKHLGITGKGVEYLKTLLGKESDEVRAALNSLSDDIADTYERPKQVVSEGAKRSGLIDDEGVEVESEESEVEEEEEDEEDDEEEEEPPKFRQAMTDLHISFRHRAKLFLAWKYHGRTLLTFKLITQKSEKYITLNTILGHVKSIGIDLGLMEIGGYLGR
jgi:hypothetical protein